MEARKKKLRIIAAVLGGAVLLFFALTAFSLLMPATEISGAKHSNAGTFSDHVVSFYEVRRYASPKRSERSP
jgi:hypothetical protein